LLDWEFKTKLKLKKVFSGETGWKLHFQDA